MRRAILNLMIDSVAAALLTALVGTAYILWFALPPGTQRTHTLWGLLRHQWGAVHFWIGALLLAVLAVHVALHWRWLVLGLNRRFGAEAWAQRSPRLAGLAVIAAAALPLTTLAVAAQLSVRPMDRPLHPLRDDATTGAGPLDPAGHEPAGPTSAVASRRCSRNAARRVTAPGRPRRGSVPLHLRRWARRSTASAGWRPGGATRAACSRWWAPSPPRPWSPSTVCPSASSTPCVRGSPPSAADRGLG